MELRQYLRVLRAHWLGILIITIAGVGVAYGWTLLQPRVYTADSSGYVAAIRTDRSSSDATGTAYVGDNLARQKVKSYVDLGTWRSVAQYAIDDLHLDTTPEQLVQRVHVSNPNDTVTIRVQASANSPEGARDLAQSWMKGLAQEIGKIESSDGATTAAIELRAGESAALPAAPSSPNVRLALLIGGLVGLALGIAYAVLRFTLDRRIRSADGVEKETGLSVVGAIPDEKAFTPENRLIPFEGGISASSTHAHLFAVAEAMRELRTNIQFMNVDHPPRVLVITSPLPGEGKSTTAANLAITLAAAGQPVMLLDADLRRPMLTTVFGLVEGAGLTDVLAGRVEIDDVAQRIGNSLLYVVGAGKIPPNPSEVLGSERMRALLASLATRATVILDAPPLLPVTDAAILANAGDGALIVSSVGKTTFEVLRKALANLERAGAHALGVVLNRVPRRGSGAVYYGYRYTGDYYRAETSEQASREVSMKPGPKRTPSPSDPSAVPTGDQASPSRRERRSRK